MKDACKLCCHNWFIYFTSCQLFNFFFEIITRICTLQCHKCIDTITIPCRQLHMFSFYECQSKVRLADSSRKESSLCSVRVTKNNTYSAQSMGREKGCCCCCFSVLTLCNFIARSRHCTLHAVLFLAKIWFAGLQTVRQTVVIIAHPFLIVLTCQSSCQF